MKHTMNCITSRDAERTALSEYKSKWPNHCSKCDGEGGHMDYEYRGEYHGTLASEQVFENCPQCVDNNQCPRCSSQNNNFFYETVIDGEEQANCFSCGWKEGDSGVPQVLSPYDCGCFEFDNTAFDFTESRFPLEEA